MFRYTAENIGEFSEKIKSKQVIFAGFNAISESEKVIISYFLKAKKGAIYWDADKYYIDEAGLGITTNKVVDDWLEHYGCVLWPSTGKGFCGYESLAMSRAWLLAQAEENGLG